MIYTFGLCNIFWNELLIVVSVELSGSFELAIAEFNVATLGSCVAQNIKISFPVFFSSVDNYLTYK